MASSETARNALMYKRNSLDYMKIGSKGKSESKLSPFPSLSDFTSRTAESQQPTTGDGAKKRPAGKIFTLLKEYNCLPPPIFIPLICIAQVAVFYTYYITEPPQKRNIMTACPGCFDNQTAGILMFSPTNKVEAWRFISYMLLHSGLPDLLSNVFLQLLVGVPLEFQYKFWRIGPLYLISVATGGLIHFTFDPQVPLTGSSSGVYALLFVQLNIIIIEWSEMPLRFIRIFALLVWLYVDLAMFLFRTLLAEDCEKNSHSAHLGAAITVIFLGLYLLCTLMPPMWEKIGKNAVLALYVSFLTVFIVLTILQNPDQTQVPDWAKCSALE